jgi:hypothetical protein
MSIEKINLWLELYTEIIGDADEMSKRGFKQKAEELYAKAEGMKEALEIFGYTVVEEYNEAIDGIEFVVVEED